MNQSQTKNDTLSSLDQLKATGTVVVADSGDFGLIAKYKPQDSTTNPTLILAASGKKQYRPLVEHAIEYGKAHGKTRGEKVDIAMDKLLVEFGTNILKIVPGRVSNEIDARLSFDKDATVKKALHIIKLYEDEGISKDRILIKVAATWEGIQAAKELEEKHGVHCNLTLLFSFVQAAACAEANVTLISPFVARITDYYKSQTGKDYSEEEDPGVQTVKRIYDYYKSHCYKTIIMGASLRTVKELNALAGIDFVTLPLGLLEELSNSTEPIEKHLDPDESRQGFCKDVNVSYINNEAKFRYDMNSDPVVTEKLSDGIRKFAADIETLQRNIEAEIPA